ncbi:hypothetical protein NGM10_03500 [Halorussus salilacus]|uniref:hypothetical protein n=1 Tax=Halorussus salilacus TaxID=2953750 RepID=UPI0020A188DC|nr:hypothetical protein [Halorussus salilacus]USZ68807.1 hypothetical protein NGM10_03500 [Halorussus salilacus]
MGALTVSGYRNAAAVVAVAATLATAYLLFPHPLVRYGAWLVAFAVWMAWFVAAARDWIADADF